jgi:hypothetical protein
LVFPEAVGHVVIVARILFEGVSFGLMLVGLVLLVAAALAPRPALAVGEKLLLWGVGLVGVGAASGVIVALTLR